MKRGKMLSKNKIKYIQSLGRKKVRDEDGLFVAEGNKLVDEALESKIKIETLVCTEEFLAGRQIESKTVNELVITDKESIKKASLLQAPQEALVVMKQFPVDEPDDISYQLILVLDCIQDPGNLGTILRIADWFGIETLVCSPDTVDVYNPKVIQASMGAIFRTKVVYSPLVEFIGKAKQQNMKVYGTFLDGENIYRHPLASSGLIVMGNEGKGISPEIEELIDERISIPSFARNTGPESLNVAVATAVCCSEFRRRIE